MRQNQEVGLILSYIVINENSRAKKTSELEKKVRELEKKVQLISWMFVCKFLLYEKKTVEHQNKIAEREKLLMEKKAEQTTKLVKKQLTGKNRENKKLICQVSNQRKLLVQERDKRIQAEQAVNNMQKRLQNAENICVKWRQTYIQLFCIKKAY